MARTRMASRRSFPPNLYLNTNGYYYYRNPQTGKKKGLGSDKAEAFRQARAANAVLATVVKTDLVQWVTGVKSYTFAEWLPVYWETWVKDSEPAPSTVKAARSYINRMEKAEFAKRPIATITTSHIAQYLDELTKASTAPTIRAIRAKMQDVFRMAETKGLVETGKNPVTSTYIPDYKVERSRLSYEQFVLIVENSKPWMQRVLWLALLSAQRREDLVNMKFDDIKEGYLFVKQSKTGAMLQLNLSIGLKAAGKTLGDAINECRTSFKGSFVVSARDNQKTSLGGGYLAELFAEARDQLNIDWGEKTPATFHEIRSLAERMYLKEHDAAFAQSLLGHKHARMTEEYNDLRGTGWNLVEVKPIT